MLETRKEYKFIISNSELENFKFFNNLNLVAYTTKKYKLTLFRLLGFRYL